MVRAIWIISAGLLLVAASVAVWPISDRAPVRAPDETGAVTDAGTDRLAARFSSPPLFERSAVAEIAGPLAATPAHAAVAIPVLAGIAEDELGMLAWLGTAQVGVRPLRPDDEIDGWTVSRITATEVELTRGARTEVLRFFAADSAN